MIVEVRGRYKEIRLEGSYVFKWAIDDALHNSGLWIFFIVAVILPVVLSVIPDIVAMFANDTIPRIDKNKSILTKAEFMTISIMYYLCISLVAVFITIEASLLMSLKNTTGIWMGIVLAAMILDMTSFLILYGMGDPLEEWDGTKFEVSGSRYFLLLAYFCIISSLLTIMFARASREMLFETLVMEGAIDRTLPGERAEPKKKN